MYEGTFPSNIGCVSLRERLTEVMEENGWNARDWARAAGMPPESHSNGSLWAVFLSEGSMNAGA